MQKLTPCLWFDKDAEAAVDYYVSVFKDGKILNKAYYSDSGAEVSGMPKGTLMTVTFELQGQKFMGLNGGPIFKFNEAVSFIVSCKDQEEVDYYWKHLSAEGEEGPCGWVKDKFGLSWQVVPSMMDELAGDPDKTKVERMMKAMLSMKKLNIHELQKAFDGE